MYIRPIFVLLALTLYFSAFDCSPIKENEVTNNEELKLVLRKIKPCFTEAVALCSDQTKPVEWRKKCVVSIE